MTMTRFLAGATLGCVVHSSTNDDGVARRQRLRTD
jgi:hypothetical protein